MHQLADAVLCTSCRPCAMCTNAIARTGIARVVFVLDTADLDSLKPPGYRNPDAHQPTCHGPALVESVRTAATPYYRNAP